MTPLSHPTPISSIPMLWANHAFRRGETLFFGSGEGICGHSAPPRSVSNPACPLLSASCRERVSADSVGQAYERCGVERTGRTRSRGHADDPNREALGIGRNRLRALSSHRPMRERGECRAQAMTALELELAGVASGHRSPFAPLTYPGDAVSQLDQIRSILRSLQEIGMECAALRAENKLLREERDTWKELFRTEIHRLVAGTPQP